MNTQEMIDLCKKHTMFSWSASGAVNPLPIERTEGIYLYTPEGERIIDFNSQLMSVNIGHSHPKVIEAIKKQLDTGLIYTFPASATATGWVPGSLSMTAGSSRWGAAATALANLDENSPKLR